MDKQYIIELIGVDGSGKTSIAKAIASKTINDINFNFVNGFEHSIFTNELINIASKSNLTKREAFSDNLINAVWIMDLINTWFTKIKPIYQKGNSLIFDRYILSAKTYSLSTTNSDLSYMFGIYDLLPQPDIIIFLKVDIDRALERIEKRGKTNTYYENKEYLTKIERQYYTLLQNKENVLVVDANEDFENVLNTTERVIKKLID